MIMVDTSEIVGHMNGEKNYLAVLNPEKLKENTEDLMDFFVNKRKWTCIYVSLNKPYEAVKKNLEERGYDLKKFFFVDAVSGEYENKVSNVAFVPSSSALTQIDIAVTQMVQFTQSQGFVLIDTLEGLLINNEKNAIANFIKSIAKKSVKYNSKSIVLSSGGSEKNFINTIAPFFDKVIKIDSGFEATGSVEDN